MTCNITERSSQRIQELLVERVKKSVAKMERLEKDFVKPPVEDCDPYYGESSLSESAIFVRQN